jgi:hypothetical protein
VTEEICSPLLHSVGAAGFQLQILWGAKVGFYFVCVDLITSVPFIMPLVVLVSVFHDTLLPNYFT